MNKVFLRAMFVLLSIALFLSACGLNKDNESTSDNAQHRNSYTEFFDGNAVTVNSSRALFRAPNIYNSYVSTDMEGYELTITRFAVLDMDNDGTDEIVLNVFWNEYNEEYVILTCFDNTVYANKVAYRGFLSPKADGTFGGSGGALDNGVYRACFEAGTLLYDEFASMSPEFDDNGEISGIFYRLNGESVDEATYQAFLDEQHAKDDLEWTDFTLEAINAALAK